MIGFYVSVVSGSRTGLLVGPFDTHEQALALVDPARIAAARVDDRAHFYAYGIVRVTAKPGRALPVGKLNTILGV